MGNDDRASHDLGATIDCVAADYIGTFIR